MKFLSLPSFDVVTSALNFDTPDCHVSGSCDLYTTKAAGTDKKLYKNIDQSLESQHAALLKFGASLSPPQRDSMAASMNLSRSSPFGNFSEVSSRRTFAYLIATLNASHPDYDFSQVLRPTEFKREKNLVKVMNHIDSTLNSVRPSSTLTDAAGPRNSPAGAINYGAGALTPAWGPQMWAMIDQEMKLKDCSIFSYNPVDDPFDEEEGAIWALHYFFFNKTLKRVCYLYVRGAPVVSHSPCARPHATGGGPVPSSLKCSALGGGSSVNGALKRATYWLGDRAAAHVPTSNDDDDDGLVWNRDASGDLNYGDNDDDLDDMLEEDDNEEDNLKRPRGVSEDIAWRMEF